MPSRTEKWKKRAKISLTYFIPGVVGLIAALVGIGTMEALNWSELGILARVGLIILVAWASLSFFSWLICQIIASWIWRKEVYSTYCPFRSFLESIKKRIKK